VNKVILIFPDQASIADFIVSSSPDNAEVDSLEQSLTAVLTPKEIELARDLYGAMLKSEIKGDS
jgi:hypothetical protein